MLIAKTARILLASQAFDAVADIEAKLGSFRLPQRKPLVAQVWALVAPGLERRCCRQSRSRSGIKPHFGEFIHHLVTARREKLSDLGFKSDFEHAVAANLLDLETEPAEFMSEVSVVDRTGHQLEGAQAGIDAPNRSVALTKRQIEHDRMRV